MPKLHVIWDRDGILETQLPREKFKVAVMDISNELSNDEIKSLTTEIGTLLFEQVRIDEP